jgi:hypothetical protein
MLFKNISSLAGDVAFANCNAGFKEKVREGLNHGDDVVYIFNFNLTMKKFILISMCSQGFFSAR